ncbi:MAG: hypothetical protein ACLPM8_12330 [Myxococcaceae bacterium]
MDSTELLQRVRWSYELGRLRVALPGVALAAALVAYAMSRPHPGSAPVLGGLLLLVTLFAGLWRRVSARAVLPSLGAGLVPFLVPALAMRAGMGCGLRDCTTLCLVSCLAGGLGAGALIVWRSTVLVEGRRLFLGVSGTVATLAGALGCADFGAIGLLLLLGGCAVVLSPAWALSRRTAAA